MLDDIDKKILDILLKNSKLSYRRIARKTGISTGTVINRIQKMKENGIIKGYCVLLDYEKMGYSIGTLIDVRLTGRKSFELDKIMKRNPNVFAMYNTTGGFDVQLVARFEDRKELDDFLKRLEMLDYVERTETKLILKFIKESKDRI